MHAQLMPAALCCTSGVAPGQEDLSHRSPEPLWQHPPGHGTRQPLLSSQALPAITPLPPLLPMSRVIPLPGEFFKACFCCQRLTEALFLAFFLSLSLASQRGGRGARGRSDRAELLALLISASTAASAEVKRLFLPPCVHPRDPMVPQNHQGPRGSQSTEGYKCTAQERHGAAAQQQLPAPMESSVRECGSAWLQEPWHSSASSWSDPGSRGCHTQVVLT